MIINLVGLEKQSRPGHLRGYLRVQNFIDDMCLCPMAALVEYNKRVSVFRPYIFFVLLMHFIITGFSPHG